MNKAQSLLFVLYIVLFLTSCSGVKSISEPFVPNAIQLIEKIDSITAVNLKGGWIESFVENNHERPIIVVQSQSDLDTDTESINLSIQKSILNTGKARILKLPLATQKLTGNELVTKSSADYSITTIIKNTSTSKKSSLLVVQKIWNGDDSEAIGQSDFIIFKQ